MSRPLADDPLHQLDIGIIGRHLMGALDEVLSGNARARRKLGERLRRLPNCSAKPLRIPTSLKAMSSNMTGHEWRSTSGVRVLRALVSHSRSTINGRFLTVCNRSSLELLLGCLTIRFSTRLLSKLSRHSPRYAPIILVILGRSF